jgi:hypothetical protein
MIKVRMAAKTAVVGGALIAGALGLFVPLASATPPAPTGSFCMGPIKVQTPDDGPDVDIACGFHPILDAVQNAVDNANNSNNNGYYDQWGRWHRYR